MSTEPTGWVAETATRPPAGPACGEARAEGARHHEIVAEIDLAEHAGIAGEAAVGLDRFQIHGRELDLARRQSLAEAMQHERPHRPIRVPANIHPNSMLAFAPTKSAGGLGGAKMLKRVLVIVAPLMACLPSVVLAAEPDMTEAFLTYCDDHFDACKDRIIGVDNINLINSIGGEHPTCFINARDKPALIDAAKAVLVWLGQHPETKTLKTDDSITKAIAALWPC
jgi:hypothetical protein